MNSEVAFGVGAIPWLISAVLVTLVVTACFLVVGNALPWLRRLFAFKTGLFSIVLLCFVALINLLEACWRGGVSDYIAMFDKGVGSALVVNLGDVYLVVALAGVYLSPLFIAHVYLKMAQQKKALRDRQHDAVD